MPVCERHRNETLLSCGRCGKPVCPDCSVFGPVGVRCRECASFRSSHIYQVSTANLAPAAIVAALVGAVSALILSRVPIGILGAFWIAFLLGSVGGEAALRACGRKRGPAVEATSGASVAFGYLVGAVANAVSSAGSAWTAVIMAEAPMLMVGLVVTVVVAVSRVRYL